MTQSRVIDELNGVRAKFCASEKNERGERNLYYKQIQVNRAYLNHKDESAQTMVNAVAHEIYHALQLVEVEKMIRGEATTRDRSVIGQWAEDFGDNVYRLAADKAYRERILEERKNQLREKQLALAALNLTEEDKQWLNFDIKALETEINEMDELVQLRYRNLQLEKDAHGFGDVIEKVFIDKIGSN